MAIPPAEDPLRKRFRFPSGEPWQMTEQVETGLHVVTLEAQLPSPQDADGDYYMARSPKAQPARNVVSANRRRGARRLRVPGGPARPVLAARDRADALPDRAQERPGRSRKRSRRPSRRPSKAGPQPRGSRTCAGSIASCSRSRSRARSRPSPSGRSTGPASGDELEEIYDRLDERQKQLAARLATLTTGVAVETDRCGDRIGLRHAAARACSRSSRRLGLPSPDRGRAHPRASEPRS